METGARNDVLQRAILSAGRSGDAIYTTVATRLQEYRAGGVLADVGCGHGTLWRVVGHRFSRCIGVDVCRFDNLPEDVEFRQADLDASALPIDSASVDVAAAVETIEHLENPRGLVRELTRITRPGGLVVVTTPNQLSLLSLGCLIVKGQFVAFQDGSYPAHRTALLETDLRRIAAECGLTQVSITFTCDGRLPLTARHHPRAFARLFPRALSDNIVMAAVRGEV